ncbi:hypothetical protein [Nocardia sp. NPDC059239]|uniref:hypothetical protein n=1 Tax=unclassified Nocardia TaxID=2637762 RepID=UPI0036D1BF69
MAYRRIAVTDAVARQSLSRLEFVDAILRAAVGPERIYVVVTRLLGGPDRFRLDGLRSSRSVVRAFANSLFSGPILGELADINVIDLIDRAWDAGLVVASGAGHMNARQIA